MKNLLYILVFLPFTTLAQNDDSLIVRRIHDQALEHGRSYQTLRSLCKDVGARLAGSAEADMAVEWGFQRLSELELDTVYLQEIMVPHWVRGNTESVWMVDAHGKVTQLHGLALGGSVGTDGLLEGQVVRVTSLEQVEELGEQGVKGKIVFYDRPMDPNLIDTFRAYGGCVDQRWAGTSKASEFGAIAVVIRSMSTGDDHHAHTGSMGYIDGVEPIPGMALGNRDADAIDEALEMGSVTIRLSMDCKLMPEKKSYNVIGEIRGGESPDQIISIGGHLDSWDVGEGAHDDGAGIAHTIEAARIFKALDLKPRHTVRFVLFMNEENGNRGGLNYAKVASENGEKHLAALESDRGGFSPRGFSIKGSAQQYEFIRTFETFLEPYLLHFFQPGFAGVDINPLSDLYSDILMLGLIPDSQRYFDYHHAESDVFESVNKRELSLGAAAFCAMTWLIDQHLEGPELVEVD